MRGAIAETPGAERARDGSQLKNYRRNKEAVKAFLPVAEKPIGQAAQKGPGGRRRGKWGYPPQVGLRRTLSVRRSDERPRQRRRWAFFSSLSRIPEQEERRLLLAVEGECGDLGQLGGGLFQDGADRVGPLLAEAPDGLC